MPGGSGGLALALADPVSGPSRKVDERRRWTDLRIRLLSASVLGPLALLCLWIGNPAWFVLVAIGGIVMALEWVQLCGGGAQRFPLSSLLLALGGIASGSNGLSAVIFFVHANAIEDPVRAVWPIDQKPAAKWIKWQCLQILGNKVIEARRRVTLVGSVAPQGKFDHSQAHTSDLIIVPGFSRRSNATRPPKIRNQPEWIAISAHLPTSISPLVSPNVSPFDSCAVYFG